MTVEAIHVFNAYVFECCNDSNYIDINMYIIHIYIVFFHPVHGYWHQITLGHVYKHHLGALRLLAVAVVAVAIRAVAADLRKLSRLCPLSRRRLFLRDATVVTVTAMFLRGATVVRVGIRSPGLR